MKININKNIFRKKQKKIKYFDLFYINFDIIYSLYTILIKFEK